MLNWCRLQKQVPLFEKINKLGYVVTELDLQHSASRVGIPERKQNMRTVRTESTMKKLSKSSTVIYLTSQYSFNF